LLDELLGFALLDLPMTRRPEALAHRGYLLLSLNDHGIIETAQ
jgi:hypothetical protein